MMIVFIHGADGYAEDRELAENLERKLGIPVHYPRMPDTDDWSAEIAEALYVNPEPIVVAHSAGGYQLLTYLADSGAPVRSLHLIAVPFPGGDAEWTFDGFDLPDLTRLRAPVFLYASEDDEVVPFAHRDLWAAAIPGSVTRTTTGGHQLDGDLWVVAEDIRAL